MSPYTHRQQREIFHLLFLERLLQISDPKWYVLKGGVNLRFFFGSPRYSEDMDVDVLGGSVATLKKNGYKILEDQSLRRVLRTYGIDNLRLSDPGKAKQTATTQRFRLRLVMESGEEYPTKVEFSRRKNLKQSSASYKLENISPEIIGPYQRLTFACQHYTIQAVIDQKLRALANRKVVQARDPFDIYVLYLGGRIPKNFKNGLAPSECALAQRNLEALTYQDYLGQVVEYISGDSQSRFRSPVEWQRICQTVNHLITSGVP